MILIILGWILGVYFAYGMILGDDFAIFISLAGLLATFGIYLLFFRPRPRQGMEEYTKLVKFISKLYAIVESSHVIMEPKMGKYVLKMISEIYMLSSYSMGVSANTAGSYWKTYLDISRKEVENGEY